MTLDAVSEIQRFADAGLPVVLSGGLPGYYPSGEESEDSRVVQELHKLYDSPNVHAAKNGELGGQTRDTPNPAPSTGFDIRRGCLVPGVPDYDLGRLRLQANTTRVPLALAANQTIILAFTNDWTSEVATPSVHAVQLPSSAWSYNYARA
ncbi:hypothetical protein N7512_008135 [Penicillium capsulatum]|nr:hypothetical protein N7512_008135 [Penicillium capsulatum]